MDQLYVDPQWAGKGIGSRLIELAKARRPEGLDLWTFQANAGAARFYERHDFKAVEQTKGETNEEGAPDIHYQWRGDLDVAETADSLLARIARGEVSATEVVQSQLRRLHGINAQTNAVVRSRTSGYSRTRPLSIVLLPNRES